MTNRTLFVVKLGGALLDDGDALAATLASVAALHRAQPGSVVVVHGGGSAVDRHLDRLNMATVKRDGIRLTPPDQMIEIASVLSGRVNTAIVAGLLARSAQAVGLSLADGFLASASKSTRFDFDAGRVGEVSDGDPKLLLTLLSAGFLPVISSVAVDAQGELLNVNADDAAAAVAKIASATRLIFLTDVSGVLDQDGRLIPRITASLAEKLIADGTIRGGMLPKVRNALETAEAIGIPVVIAGWQEHDILSRLARSEVVGTTLTPLSLSSGASSISTRPQNCKPRMDDSTVLTQRTNGVALS